MLAPRRVEGRAERSEGTERSGVRPSTRRRERRRGLVSQRTVRPAVIVRQLVILAQHPRLRQAGEQLTIQQLVPKPTVERLAVGILPRAARRDVQRLDAALRQELANRLGDELRAIVAADVPRRPADLEQIAQGAYETGSRTWLARLTSLVQPLQSRQAATEQAA